MARYLRLPMIRRSVCVAMMAASLVPPVRVWAQTPATAEIAAGQVFNLEQALQYAVDHYPTVRAALERILATARFPLAVKPRHGQQHLRSGPAPIRDSGDV